MLYNLLELFCEIEGYFLLLYLFFVMWRFVKILMYRIIIVYSFIVVED